MIPVIEVVFTPFPGSTEVGRLEMVSSDVAIYEAIRGGYYLAAPSISYAGQTLEEIRKTSLAVALQQGSFPHVRGVETGNVSLLDWCYHWAATQYKDRGASVDHHAYNENVHSQLKHFNTVQFVTALPNTMADLVAMLSDMEMVAVTHAADYESLVELALDRAKNQWSTAFVQDLIKRIARGADNGNFCTWNECRAATYALKPHLKGTLRSWDDWNQLDLSSIFSPVDFEQKDDIIVGTVLKERLFSVDAFREVFCVPGLYDGKRSFLHWSYQHPETKKDKEPMRSWSVQLTSGGPTWDLDYSANVARLQPEAGTTYSKLQNYLKKEQLPDANSLPYKLPWTQLDAKSTFICPHKTTTGLQIISTTQLPPLLVFPKLKPIADVPGTSLAHLLSDYGAKVPDGDQDKAEAFCELLESLYPEFDQSLSTSLVDKPMLRVNPSEAKDVPTMSSVLFPNHQHPLIIDYLLAFFLCLHMRGKVILDPAYTSELYTPKGIFGDLTRSGYPPADASFASRRDKDKRGLRRAPEFLIFCCPYGAPEPVDLQMKATKVEAAAGVEEVQSLNIDEVDTILDDFI